MAELEQKNKGDLRPPVVAVLGHIDHGKSSLIDYIRKTNITASEAGGITQHASVYEITHTSKDGRAKKITFLDTPGHEAFASIRTRCTNIADIAALIVSAEDGVKPQTLEIIKYIKECGMPILVVITKIDKPSADVLRTKQNLAENDVYVEGYGGDTPVVEVSAVSGQGVDEFLDMICLMAEISANSGDREALGRGVIVEARRDSKRGIIAVGIIKDGTVRQGLFAAAQDSIAPIRFLLDAEGNTVEELSFSSPVQIVGWDNLPEIGSEFQTFLKKKDAQEFVDLNKSRVSESKSEEKLSEDVNTLPIVVKADTAGSLEALTEELKKVSRERIVPKIVLSGIGSVSENDIKAAFSAKGALIFTFNSKVDPQAGLLAERLGIKILNFNIIYEFTDKVKELLEEREPKIEVEEIASTSKVLKTFGVTKDKQVVGARVLSGIFKRGAIVKIIRRDIEIGQGKVKELQQAKVATDSAIEGTEFGTMIESKIEIVPGDMLNTVTLVTK